MKLNSKRPLATWQWFLIGVGVPTILGIISFSAWSLFSGQVAAFDKIQESSRKIAFTSRRNGNSEIYLINADGTGLKNLTNNPSSDGLFNWSPDGKKILFISDRSGKSEFYTMNIDGTELAQVSSLPIWSPDGKKTIFIDVSKNRSETNISVMNIDGSDHKRLTNNLGNVGSATWSPDNHKIAFTSMLGGGKTYNTTSEIYTINVDGLGLSKLTNITAKEAINVTPTWSPDGRHIAFVSTRDHGDVYKSEIYVMNKDGSNQTRLTRDGLRIDTMMAPISYSPDGNYILYSRKVDESGTSDIFRVRADGSDQLRLTNTKKSRFPAWSPNSHQIAYTSFEGDKNEKNSIYIVDVDGSNQRLLTDNGMIPKWQPSR
jgi:Tol biopolymer transport system component